MTDIVERLRKQCTCPRCSSDADHMLNEGAFEIERLRKELEDAADTFYDTGLLDAWAKTRAALND